WLGRRLAELKDRLAAAEPVRCLVEEGPWPRPAFVLLRGDVRLPGEEVQPEVPEVLARRPLPFPDPPPGERGSGGSGRRLTLARWIASPDNPLVARVLVNRLWQYHFGRGIGETSRDFGRRGARPSHPELLNWLAGELIRQGWSIKALQRLMMTSSVYRQGSAAGPGGAARDSGDGDNRYLGRFPPRRLEAEAIR